MNLTAEKEKDKQVQKEFGISLRDYLQNLELANRKIWQIIRSCKNLLTNMTKKMQRGSLSQERD